MRDLAVLAATDPVVLALVPVVGGIAVALIPTFSQARRDLIADLKERISMRDARIVELEKQVKGLEATLREQGRDTRGEA